MRCSAPFMRDHSGRVHKISELTPEKRLEYTPFPCGWCLPCRINKARMWQHRIILESKSHMDNIFVTLTYNDECVPLNDNADLILHKPDLQNFMKRLRRKKDGERIRYFSVGEYGDESERPHYHICLFGLGKESCESIESSWTSKRGPYGIVHVGEITPESARYIAGYTIKKLTRPNDERLRGKPPEFMLSSKRGGGIGHDEVVRIAKRIKNNPYLDTNEILNTFTIGGKAFPLGGYLTNVLFNNLGFDPVLKEQKLKEYQDKLFVEHEINTDSYYHNIIDSSRQYRKNLERRHSINKKERKI